MYLQYPYCKNNSEKHNFDEIIIVVPDNWINTISQEMKKKCSISKVVAGGQTRTESSYLGLKACSPECINVLIHDSARPFASEKTYNSCIKYLEKYDSVIPLVSTKDTPLYIEPNKKNQKASFLNRDYLKGIQTPQGFKYHCIKSAYDNKKNDKTDDLQVLLEYNPKTRIRFIQGDEKNFKITTRRDIQLIKELYDSGKHEILY